MSVLTDYPLGVQAIFNSKRADSFLRNYNYFFTALAQSYQVYTATKIAAKTLQAYNRPMVTFPWYVRALAVTAVPFSICFEINRWSSDYQPHFWIKKTIHWVCDHIGQFMYATCVVSSVALAVIGKPGMLMGIAVTFSIDQIQNYDVLPTYYCHVLKTVNVLASVFFSKGAFSCWMSVTELVGNLYFSRSVQNTPLHTITNTIVTDKRVIDVKNNPSHIHFKPELKTSKAEDLLVIFDGIEWDLTQMKKLLSKDNDWIKKVDTRTDPVSYVKNLRKYIEDVHSNPKRLVPIELYLKVIVQYLCNHPEKHLENKKLVLDVIAQLRKNSQEGINRLGEIAEDLYEGIDSFPFEEQVLQLLYKKRKGIFEQFFNEELYEKTMVGSFKEVFHPCAKDAFDSHMGIRFFLTDRTSSIIKVSIHVICKAEEVNAEKCFCDQEGNPFYTSQSIIDLLMNQLGNTLSWDSVNQWWQEQKDLSQEDKTAIKSKISSMQEKFINENDDIQQVVDASLKIEKLLVSMLLKMRIFQLKD